MPPALRLSFNEGLFLYYRQYLIKLSAVDNVEQAIEKITNGNPERQNCKPVLFEKWHPLVSMGKSLVFDKLSEEDIAPDRAQSESDGIKNQPEYDVFCCYFRPVFLCCVLDRYNISQIPGCFHNSTNVLPR